MHTDKLSHNSVHTDKLSYNNVHTDNLLYSSVHTDKLSYNSVHIDKLTGVNDRIFSKAKAAAGGLTVEQVNCLLFCNPIGVCACSSCDIQQYLLFDWS